MKILHFQKRELSLYKLLNKKIMEKESLIGKKVKGFEFESGEYAELLFEEEMDRHVGEIGEIMDYDEEDDSYKVQFKSDWWYYPAKLIEKHLINNHPLIITKQTKVRAGKKYYTWQFSKNKKVSSHQYNQAGTRNKQLNQFLEDIKSGNYEIK